MHICIYGYFIFADALLRIDMKQGAYAGGILNEEKECNDQIPYQQRGCRGNYLSDRFRGAYKYYQP